ncbi:MAG: HxlR-like helix-turn-helix [Methanomassiliicoccales archaeon PtaU1.Bin124]|nr:MAG: HxlR-like helix-turn-helix [Methanomassiliicoccales archaeon PtaU1.Bin124]
MASCNKCDECDQRCVCPVEATLALIEGKWKPLLLLRLKSRTLRFNQLASEMPGISPKMLTKQLRELERDGLVGRTMYPEIPPRVEYFLTEKGESLMPVLKSMGEWGVANLKDKLIRPSS